MYGLYLPRPSAAATLSRIKSGTTRGHLSQWQRNILRIIDVDVSAAFLRTERSERICAFIRDVTETLHRRRLVAVAHRVPGTLDFSGFSGRQAPDRRDPRQVPS